MTEALALFGGRPVRERLLPYGRQCIEEDDVSAVVEALRSDWLTTGPRVQAFEEAFAAAVGAKHAVALSNGTAALHAAAFAAGVSPGDEVVTTPMTFAASANCARYLGATPRFADVERDTLNLDPAAAAALVGPRTRAIVAVDFSGQPADALALGALAARAGAVLIEDAAHSLGATLRGRKVGALATLTTFSFHGVKLITTGEGGMVTTDDPELAKRLRSFRNHGIDSDARERAARGDWFYEMTALGFNYRLTDLQCALGLSQLGKLERFVARRRELARRYHAEFEGLQELERPLVRPDRDSAWHLYVVRLHLPRLRGTRREIFKALKAENVGVNVHYIPVTAHPYYRELGHRAGECPVAEAEYERMLTLPLHPSMSDGDADDVVAAVRKVLAHYRL